jgi:hypothetical protein
MSNARFPTYQEPVVDSQRLTTIPWRNWFESLNTLLEAGLISDAQLAKAVLNIVQALGSTDNTADTIINVAATDIIGEPPVQVTGDMRNGWHVRLPAGFGIQHPLNTPFSLGLTEPEFPWPQTSPGNASGSSGTDSQVPFYIPPGENFTVAENKQALYVMPIEIDGDLVVDGFLVEVA